MIGAYTSANFSGKADGNGNVEIVDPVPNISRSARTRRSLILRTAPCRI